MFFFIAASQTHSVHLIGPVLAAAPLNTGVDAGLIDAGTTRQQSDGSHTIIVTWVGQ
jgi:hypothetical protein